MQEMRCDIVQQCITSVTVPLCTVQHCTVPVQIRRPRTHMSVNNAQGHVPRTSSHPSSQQIDWPSVASIWMIFYASDNSFLHCSSLFCGPSAPPAPPVESLFQILLSIHDSQKITASGFKERRRCQDSYLLRLFHYPSDYVHRTISHFHILAKREPSPHCRQFTFIHKQRFDHDMVE